MFRRVDDSGTYVAKEGMGEINRGVNILKGLLGRIDNFGSDVAKGAIREIDRGVKKVKEVAAGALDQIGVNPKSRPRPQTPWRRHCTCRCLCCPCCPEGCPEDAVDWMKGKR